jgi:hypothetical protein
MSGRRQKMQNALNYFITHEIKKRVLDDDLARIKLFIIAYNNTLQIEKIMNSPSTKEIFES